MFLFTTPSAPPVPPPATVPTGPVTPITEAIRRGAAQTGTSFDYLLNTARRESALDPAAKASTSSATGLFQFIEQTWLSLVKSEGGKLGLPDLAQSISARGDGTYGVDDAGTRQTILKLRENPDLASVLAGTLTQQNRDALAAATGREPSSGELYMAHVLGPRGASDLIRSAQQSPDRAAAIDLPDAAAANRSIFYDRSGRARGSAEVYAVLAATRAPAPDAAGPATSVSPIGAVAAPPEPPKTVTGQTGSGLNGLFQTGSRPGPMSEAVAKLWRVNNASASTRGPAVAFFPRSDGASMSEAAAADEVAAPAAGTAVEITGAGAPAAGPTSVPPLPPPRPRGELRRAGAWVGAATAPAGRSAEAGIGRRS